MCAKVDIINATFIKEVTADVNIRDAASRTTCGRYHKPLNKYNF